MKIKNKFYIIIIAIILASFTFSSNILASNSNSQKKIINTGIHNNIENRNWIQNQVYKNIENARLFHSKDRFLEFILENKSPTRSLISSDKTVLEWNQNLNEVATNQKNLNDYIIKNIKRSTFKHIKRDENYELYSIIVPFALDVKENEKQYKDYYKVIKNGAVGINNITLVEKTINSKFYLKPQNKEIIIGTKDFIKIKDKNDYEVNNIEKELKKLKLQPVIKMQNKPKDYAIINNLPSHIEYIKTISAPNINKLKEGNKIYVTIEWKKRNDFEKEKKVFKNLKELSLNVLKKSKGLTQDERSQYLNIINTTKSSDVLHNAINEIKDLTQNYKKQQAQQKTQTTTASNNFASSNNSSGNVINNDKPKDTNAEFGLPLSDMSITQDLHDGLAIDYQPKGCYLNPGCVPAFAIGEGTAHVSSGDAYGNAVVIEHSNGYCSRYAHLNSISVTEGQKVNKGTILGMVGTTGNSTGVHLHFELRSGGSGCYGTMINPHNYGM